MTYADALALPDHTRVLLKDGKIGRIRSWYHTAEAIAVQVKSERRIIPAENLKLRADGTVVEVPEDPTAEPGARP